MAEEAGTRRRGLKFLGSYAYQIDEKGRVALPAAYRREVPDQRYVLVQVFAPALALYPEGEWVVVEERLEDLLRHQPDARMWVLRTLANAVEVAADGQGRILIPARLQEAGELDGQALLVGAINKVEIWNPERFEEAKSEAAQYDRFAPQIFR